MMISNKEKHESGMKKTREIRIDAPFIMILYPFLFPLGDGWALEERVGMCDAL